MKRYHPPRRRDRVSGKGSPYRKHAKSPYKYPFPIGAEGAKHREAQRVKEAGQHEPEPILAKHLERKADRRRSLERRQGEGGYEA